MLKIIGWFFVAVIVLQTLAAAVRHKRIYVSMAMRARLDPATGSYSEDPIDPVADRLATKYMRNSIIWSTLKFGLAVLLALILLRL